jgi:hypothetical protein
VFDPNVEGLEYFEAFCFSAILPHAISLDIPLIYLQVPISMSHHPFAALAVFDRIEPQSESHARTGFGVAATAGTSAQRGN